MRVRNNIIAETALNDFKTSLKMQNQQIEFSETLYDGVRINYLSYLPGVSLPVGIGYAFIQSDLLVLATDMSALKSMVDVLNGKTRSIIEQTQYLNVMTPIGGTSDKVVYIKLKELYPIVEQVAKLYLYQSMITGNRKAERLAVTLADNAFILESWNYLGTVWTSDEDKMNLKITLSKTD
jgi:hypothetical protein